MISQCEKADPAEIEGLQKAANGGNSAFSASCKEADFSRLKRIIDAMGGRLVLDRAGEGVGNFQLQFEARPAVVEKVETLLSPYDPDPTVMLAPELAQEDERLKIILSTIKDFMKALSAGDVTGSQKVLLFLAEQQDQAGLFNEIGLLARELHNSMKGFTETLDPTFKDMVEHKIPDSGNRLEYILELTEKAANTTLDHVEEMQRKNQEDHKKILQLSEMIQSLHAVGEQARKRLDQSMQTVEDLSNSLLQTRDDLVTVLTAQDYQDLTGQIIQKIITLLKDLELRLVSVVRAFGVKMEGRRKVEDEKLYGPAHKGKSESLHSQDDVDSLLADFGF